MWGLQMFSCFDFNFHLWLKVLSTIIGRIHKIRINFEEISMIKRVKPNLAVIKPTQ